ncbi:MAG: FAD-dependent oxidoreductase [Stagnimonas sp.]|nr:FAD-dependent oxidoreductase [Stagnimonas sp.]
MKPRLILVGNGMAGVRTLEELLKRAPGQYDITVFGEEPYGNYNRIQLSPVLAGEKTIAQIITHAPEWYAANGIKLLTGDAVVAIDREAKTVTSAKGVTAAYDVLLLATGSKPFVLPVPGKELPGVIAFRDIADVDSMLSASRTYTHAVVIGGGLLGLEAANGLVKRGMTVSVVHLSDIIMERQLDRPAAVLLQRSLESRGIKFLLKAATAELLGETRVEAVRFKDGREVPADLVVMAAGIIPNAALAKASGLECERGIVVDDALRSSDPSIYAVGECAQHRKICYGLVAPLWDQAIVCAEHLAAVSTAAYEGSVVSTKLKVTGIDLFSAGNFQGGEGSEELVFRDPKRGIYKKLVVRDGRLDGAVLVGDTRDGGWYYELIQQKAHVGHWRNKLVFGRSFCEQPLERPGEGPANGGIDGNANAARRLGSTTIERRNPPAPEAQAA